MKTKLIKTLSLLLILFVFTSCLNEDSKSKINQNNEKLNEISEKVNEIELSLKSISEIRRQTANDLIPSDNQEKFPDIYLNADFSKEMKQHIHIDLVNQLGIIAHSKIKSNGKYEMKVILREIFNNNQERNTHDLVAARYEKTVDSDDQIMHHIHLDIKKTRSSSKETYIEVVNFDQFKPKKGEIIDVHVPEYFKSLDIFTDYGQQFCKSIIIQP